MALFHHLFLRFVHIAEIYQKEHNTATLRLPVKCISQIFTAFNLYSGTAKTVCKSRINKKSDKQWLISNPTSPSPRKLS